MKGWQWWLASLPFLAGLLAMLILNGLESYSNPILYLRIDAGTFFFLLGSFLSALWLEALYMWSQSESRLAAAEKEHNQEHRRFLQRLDHELKNPLTAILAGLANIAYAQDEPQRAEMVTSVRSQVERLRRLVADLRKLSDLETRPLEQTPVDVSHVLEDAFMLAQEHAHAPMRQLSMSIPRAPWPLPHTLGDYDLLFLAIYNLLDNALKFTHAHDTIELRASEANQTILIEVADTGEGIPAEELPHVWSELYRAKQARGTPGSGLGLALVRAIITRHGGQVRVRSRVGKGTLFSIQLPVTEL